MWLMKFTKTFKQQLLKSWLTKPNVLANVHIGCDGGFTGKRRLSLVRRFRWGWLNGSQSAVHFDCLFCRSHLEKGEQIVLPVLHFGKDNWKKNQGIPEGLYQAFWKIIWSPLGNRKTTYENRPQIFSNERLMTYFIRKDMRPKTDRFDPMSSWLLSHFSDAGNNDAEIFLAPLILHSCWPETELESSWKQQCTVALRWICQYVEINS